VEDPLMSTTKNDDPLPRRYGAITKLWRYVAAALCGFCVVWSGGFLTGDGLSAIGKPWPRFMHSPEIESFVELFCGFLLTPFITLTFGVAFGRFLLRAFPPAIGGPGCRSQAWKVVPCAIVLIGVYLVGVGQGFFAAAANGPPGWAGLAFSPLFVVTWAIAGLGLFVSLRKLQVTWKRTPQNEASPS
jgi:hypothetical protein